MEWELHCSMKGLDASEGDPMCVGCPPPRSGSNTAEPPRTPEKKNQKQQLSPKERSSVHPTQWGGVGWDGVG